MPDFEMVGRSGLGNGLQALVERIFHEAGLCISKGPWEVQAVSEVDTEDGEAVVYIGLEITRRPQLTEEAFAPRAELN